jgi:hypothetical protein
VEPNHEGQQRSLFKNPSLLIATGYAIFVALPHHLGPMRIFPMMPQSPINSLSPTELDYEFVKYGVQQWPVRSWILFTVLVGATCFHAAEGTMSIVQRRFTKTNKSRTPKEPAPSNASAHLSVRPQESQIGARSRRRRRLISWSLAFVVSSLVLGGLKVAASEPVAAFSAQLSRYLVIYQNSPIYW